MIKSGLQYFYLFLSMSFGFVATGLCEMISYETDYDTGYRNPIAETAWKEYPHKNPEEETIVTDHNNDEVVKEYKNPVNELAMLEPIEQDDLLDDDRENKISSEKHIESLTLYTACYENKFNSPSAQIKMQLTRNIDIKYNYQDLKRMASLGVKTEWGCEIYAKFYDQNSWLQYEENYTIESSRIRKGKDHHFDPDFTDSYEDYTRVLGYMHLHPTKGTCFSPQDIETFLYLRKTWMEKRGPDAMALLVTPGDTYVLKVKDPERFKNLDLDESVFEELSERWEEVVRSTMNQEKAVLQYINDPRIKGALELYKMTDIQHNFQPLALDDSGSVIVCICEERR